MSTKSLGYPGSQSPDGRAGSHGSQAVDSNGYSKNETDVDINEENQPQLDEALAHRVLRKIDLRLIPLLILCYSLQFLDKSALGFASILGIIDDLNLVDQEYAWSHSIFFFGYLIFSYPTSVFIVNFPIGKYIASTVVVWSVILTLHAACANFGGIMAVRFFLGVGEATVAPGFALLIGTFYKRSEQPLRQCAFFFGNGVAGIFGGLIAYGVGHLNGSLPVWKYLFIIYGVITAFWGVVLLIFLPDGPATARFLTPAEREIAVKRIASNGGKKINNKYKLEHILEALKDPQTWLIVLEVFFVNLCTGGLSTFGNIIIQGFGFDLYNTLLLQIPFGVSQIFFMAVGGVICTYVANSRLICMTMLMFISITGTAMMAFVDPERSATRVGGACLAAAFAASLPMSLSLVTSNVVGFTKKATVMSMVFVAYCTGNIIGPQLFSDDEFPSYPTGLRTLLGAFSAAALLCVLLRVYYMWENARRDRLYGANTESESSADFNDDDTVTDKLNRGFRYML